MIGRLLGFGLALLGAACAMPAARPPPVAMSAAADGFRAEVRAGRAPYCPLVGTAVHLGGGRFLTAAHLVDGTAARMRRCEGPEAVPVIRYGGQDFQAAAVRIGQGDFAPGVGLRYLGGADLALLQTFVTPLGPAARPCGEGPDAGQSIIVSSRIRTLAALAGLMVSEVAPAYGAYAEIPLPLVPGESGAGVFDARTNCLLGVVSHREDATPDSARVVPSAAIRTFLGG